MFRFGLHGMMLRIKMFSRLLAKIRTGYLDY
jgi:hypothetical protein